MDVNEVERAKREQYSRRRRWLRALRRQKMRYEQVINTLLNYLMKVPDEDIRLEDMATMLLQSTIIPVLQPVPAAPNKEAAELNTVKPKEWFNRLMEKWGKGELLTPDEPKSPVVNLALAFKDILDQHMVILDKPDGFDG